MKIKFLLQSLLIAVFVGSFLSMALPNESLAQTSESISDYNVDITIGRDSSIAVKETINYDFGTAERHGIFRNIPYKYKARGGTFKLRMSAFSVTDDKGVAIPFEKSTSGNEIVLKIGDAEKTVTGKHQYVIGYKVGRAINSFADHDELYWNAVGTGWNIPIAKASAIVHAPVAINQFACFTGPDNSTEKNCSILNGNSETVTFATSQSLDVNEGLTVVAGLPANTVAKQTTAQKVWDVFLDNGILLLPIVVFIIMFTLWNKFGKDAKPKNSIVAQYESPNKMSALYTGSLLHGQVTNKDIAAEVVYLAANGFINITRVQTTKLGLFERHDYQFSKLEKTTEGLAAQTKALLDELFPGGKTESLLSDLKTNRTFGAALMDIKGKVMKELVADGYYKRNPTSVRAIGVIFGISGTFILSAFLASAVGALGFLAGLLSGIIILIFGILMPAKTQKGADTVAEIYGLQEYLTVAEKDRLKFHNAPEKNPQHFEALLPFAVALGVEAAWANQFKDLTKAPNWFTDTTGSHAFNALAFSNSIGDFSGSMQSAARAVTTSSSGGSGFSGGGSGGGGGGGGGGSW